MKVLLIYPAPPRSHWPKGLFRSRWVPSGISMLAGELQRAGHEVRIHVREEHLIKAGFDWAAADAALRAALMEFAPDIVGFSVVTPGVAEAASIASLAKRLGGRDVLTVAGGPHPTALPAKTLAECPDLDVVAIGEGEATLLELAASGPSPEVAGIAFRADGQIVHTPPRTTCSNLDALAPTPYDLYDMGHYAAADRWLIRWLNLSATNIRTSRGCPNRCRFCAAHLVAGLGVRYYSTDYVLAQVRGVLDRFGVEAVLFEDETMGADRARLTALCDGLRGLGAPRRFCWSACLRVDQAEGALLGEMKAAGCVQIEYGFESGSDRMLRRLAKNAGLEANRRAVRLTREAGLRIFANIMVGLPGETEDDFDKTVRFLRWARPDVISAAQLDPLPGTPIYNDLPAATRRGLSWADYAYPDQGLPRVNLTAMPDDRFREKFRKFMKYVVRPAIDRQLLRDTPADRPAERRRRRRKVRLFALRHPIRAARLPS